VLVEPFLITPSSSRSIIPRRDDLTIYPVLIRKWQFSDSCDQLSAFSFQAAVSKNHEKTISWLNADGPDLSGLKASSGNRPFPDGHSLDPGISYECPFFIDKSVFMVKKNANKIWIMEEMPLLLKNIEFYDIIYRSWRKIKHKGSGSQVQRFPAESGIQGYGCWPEATHNVKEKREKVIVHRRDAKGSEGYLFLLSADPAGYSGAGTP